MNCKSKKLLTVIMTVAMAFCMLFAFGTFSASADEVAETPAYSFTMNGKAQAKIIYEDNKVFVDETEVKNAIRFVSQITKGAIDDIVEEHDVKVKTIIIKKDVLGDVAFTKASLDEAELKYQQVIFSEDKNLTDNVSEDGKNYVFQACLYNVQEANYTADLCAVSYLEVDGVAGEYTNVVTANLWDVADAHRLYLDPNKDKVLDDADKGSQEELDFVSTLCKTYNVTVTSGLDSSKEQTITVKHGQKLDAYIESLSTVTAPVVGVSYFDCFVDGEDAVYSDIVTSDLTLTAKYSTIAYGYDATNDVYYVADNKAFKGDTVIIPATYNDGVHEEKAVKYVADEAFVSNTNIKKVILPESVIVVGHSSFHGCTSLTYMAMPGVTTVSSEKNGPYGVGYEKITTGGKNAFLNAPITTLIVPDGFDVRENQFVNATRTIRVYSLATTPAAWNGNIEEGNAGDRASNCIIRSGDTVNNAFINDYLETGKSPVYYYSEGYPSIQNSNYIFWHYDSNGVPAIWDAKDYIDTQGVNYNYDADDNCYYITYSPNVTVEHLVIPEKWNDGIYGEAPIKYIASVRVNNADKGAFEGNKTLKSVVLPDSVVSLNGSAFGDCSNLEYVVMRGVTKLFFNQVNRNYSGATPTFTTTGDENEKVSDLGLNSMYGMYKGYNFTGCNSLKYLVVGDGFQDLSLKGSSYGRNNFDDTVNIKVYVYGSNKASMQADNAGTFTILTYSETDLMDGAAHWYYDESGAIKEWPVLDMTDKQGVLYGYDTANDCYYVSDNKAFKGDTVIISATFNDGLHGEKAVKYVADNAFYNNDNITHVYLNVSITELGHQAFYDCGSLAHIEMPGVAIIRGSGAKTGYEGIVVANPRSTFRGCSSLTVMVVPAKFEIQEQHVVDTNRDVRVYSLSTSPIAWGTWNGVANGSMDRVDGCVLRTGDDVNNAFIITCEEGKLSPVYYYSESEPTDTNYTFWCYNTDGSIKVWGAVAE